jgi:hypothetical protein
VTAPWASVPGRVRRWTLGVACLALAAGTASPAARAADDTAYQEDAVKAAFLYRFTGYVDWPRDALGRPGFTFAVLSADTVAAELGRLVPRHTVKNLPAQVRIVRSAREATDAHLLYVGAAYTGDLEAIVEALGSHPVLVVTDRPDGLNAGSAINFMLVDQRVRFEISMPAVVRARLWVQPPLLAVAARVRSLGPRSGVAPVDPLVARVTPVRRRAAS